MPALLHFQPIAGNLDSMLNDFGMLFVYGCVNRNMFRTFLSRGSTVTVVVAPGKAPELAIDSNAHEHDYD